METMLVRLKPLDPRRGNVLRRFTYQGIKFHEERGWYRVAKAVADYLRSVHQQPADPHSPLAFDVCTEEEARAAEAKEKEAQNARKTAADDIKLSVARPAGAVTTSDLPEAPKDDRKPRKDRG
ncbi:MAG: hypothetical protein QUU85_15790 [Candidatus Eisenbacteria bacterium]|nr:hypothetical protein [Candidatus Eisenbacteria bacterium]